MTSRVTIFTKDGYQVGDIRAHVDCEYILNANPAPGRCTFDVSNSSIKASRKYLEFGNYVLIRNALLPDWIGVIVSRSWGHGVVTVMAMQVEFILSRRITPITPISGVAGSLFKQILDYTNSALFNEKPIAVNTNNIYFGGVSRDETLGNDALTHIQQISTRSGNDFDISYSFDTNGRLYLIGNWYQKKGTYIGKFLREGRNISISDRLLVEDARGMANWYEGRGDANTVGTRISTVKYDSNSINQYGLNQEAGVFDGNSVMSTLESSTLNKLANSLTPLGAFDLTVSERGFSTLGLGNIYDLDLNTAAFDYVGLGYHDLVTLYGMGYNSKDNTVRTITGRYTNA